MDLQFAGNVTPVSEHGIGGNIQVVGNLLIGHALHQRDDDILLTVGEHRITIWLLVDHVADAQRHIVLMQLILQVSNGRNKDTVLNLRVLGEPTLTIVDIVKDGRELIVVQTIRRQIFDDDILQLVKFPVDLHMMLRERLDVIIVGQLAPFQSLDIRENGTLLIEHVAAYGMSVLIVELHNETCHAVTIVKGLGQTSADEGQFKVKIIGMAGLQVVEQGGNGNLVDVLIIEVAVDSKVDDG